MGMPKLGGTSRRCSHYWGAAAIIGVLQPLLGCCSHPATCAEPSAPQQLLSEEDSPPPCPHPSTALQTNPKGASKIQGQTLSCMD